MLLESRNPTLVDRDRAPSRTILERFGASSDKTGPADSEVKLEIILKNFGPQIKKPPLTDV